MSFLDKKEQVLEIELTQFGKFLLSEGKFKPSYYAFFDDDILYDSTYADVVEAQNDIEPRVKETPRVMTQYNFSGVETEFSKLFQHVRATGKLDQDKIQTTKDKNFSLVGQMGSAQTFNQYAPAWNVKYLAGEMTGAAATLTGSHGVLQIPQLNSNLKYKYRVLESDPNTELEEIFGEFVVTAKGDVDYKFTTRQYEDGSYIENIVDFLLIDMKEENSRQSRKNFDIEVFEEYIDDNGNKTYLPMKFAGEESTVTADFINYFLDILVDDEIDSKVFCNFNEDNALGVYDSRIQCKVDEKKKYKVYDRDEPDASEDIC